MSFNFLYTLWVYRKCIYPLKDVIKNCQKLIAYMAVFLQFIIFFENSKNGICNSKLKKVWFQTYHLFFRVLLNLDGKTAFFWFSLQTYNVPSMFSWMILNLHYVRFIIFAASMRLLYKSRDISFECRSSYYEYTPTISLSTLPSEKCKYFGSQNLNDNILKINGPNPDRTAKFDHTTKIGSWWWSGHCGSS